MAQVGLSYKLNEESNAVYFQFSRICYYRKLFAHVLVTQETSRYVVLRLEAILIIIKNNTLWDHFLRGFKYLFLSPSFTPFPDSLLSTHLHLWLHFCSKVFVIRVQ